jgi:uncharacterized tellurite resistance protein B-like protein
MSISDRILPLCELLLGAAYADKELHDKEKDTVKSLLRDLANDLPSEVDARIGSFDPAKFDLAAAAAPFRDDPEDDRRMVLFLVSAVHDADEELDLAEDEYLRDLAKALALPASALDGLTVEVETEELKQSLAKVRRPPPPPPKGKSASVDVDLD